MKQLAPNRQWRSILQSMSLLRTLYHSMDQNRTFFGIVALRMSYSILITLKRKIHPALIIKCVSKLNPSIWSFFKLTVLDEIIIDLALLASVPDLISFVAPMSVKENVILVLSISSVHVEGSPKQELICSVFWSCIHDTHVDSLTAIRELICFVGPVSIWVI